MLDEMVIDGVEVPEDAGADPADTALQRAAAGEQHAFAELYDMMSPRVFGLILRVVVDRSQSEEVLQEVFLEAWQSARAFDRARGSARSWLLTIAHRRAVDRVRSARAMTRRDLTAGAREIADPGSGVDDEVALLVDGARAREALGRLPEPQRRAIVLAYFGGYSQSEIAALVGAPLGTVKTRIRDGLSRIREAWEATR
ncbi:sigma-70 family RNA polymerase sigma factor [Leucobacter allii]|uniref:RNA polymerase sigma factor n=1 Tax=Leucobacter allii TaxID=2932247 RepID=A0ABY4FH78_9MICO|nr:sigma-70 family RNA polymerase sigma factor [Leucobacter allii]UOQ56034.1 sigma-70 family RNA polymerase sigma factor [Leucobacter allii]